MASSADTDKLETRRQAILTELSTLSAGRSYSIDGQSVDHNAYRKSLLEELRTIQDLLATAGGPWEIDS